MPANHSPPIRVGLVGDPTNRGVPWNDEALDRLVELGFNAVQLNLAWEGPNPTDDPSVLAEVVSLPGRDLIPKVAAAQAEIEKRIALARGRNIRIFFQVGSPAIGQYPYDDEHFKRGYRIDDVTFDSWYDIENPAVRERELSLLKEFRKRFPDITDLLVYTYDAGAWQTAEFQYNGFSYGIPLARRLPHYLAELHKCWTEGRENTATLWWEPWQLSAGQCYDALAQLPTQAFGVVIHSAINEVQLTRPVDVWFRNVARICGRSGIPVLVHASFASTSEELEPLSIPAPRLIDEAYQAIMSTPGISGVKEYFGISAAPIDLNLEVVRARFAGFQGSTGELIDDITKRFGAAQKDVGRYLSILADAIQMYPWDAAWTARCVGRASIDHGWRAATINGAAAPTPSFSSNHHAAFMKLDNEQSHFWMLEDVELRCRQASEALNQALAISEVFVENLPSDIERDFFSRIDLDVNIMRRIALSYALHIRQTNVAQMLRQDLAAGRPLTKALLREMEELLDTDVSNQEADGRVVELRRLYRENPREFLLRYLLPPSDTKSTATASASPDLPNLSRASPERGLFSLTTR